MAKHEKRQALAIAARLAPQTNLATWGAVEAMGKKAMIESERQAKSADFAEFLLSGSGSRAIIRIGGTVTRIEG